MSVYQFCRIESFSRCGSAKKKTKSSQFANWNADDVIGEALRKEGHCPHVEKPLTPRIVFGSPDDLKKSLNDYTKNTKTASGRKLRTDALCLGSFVASYPGRTVDADYDEWVAATLAFVQEKWGDRLRLAVEHLDESNPHVHFLLVENAGKEFRLDPVKDAHRRATEQARANGISDKEVKLSEKNALAIEAGEALNREFFEKVSSRFGHQKDAGPEARTREPRAVYLAKQKAKQELEQAEQLAKQQVEQAEQFAKTILESVEPAKAELETVVETLKTTELKAKQVEQHALKVRKTVIAEKKALEREKQALEQADPTRLKRTLGRFFMQFATRLILVFALVIARPRQTKLRRMFLNARKTVKKLNEKNVVLEIQNEQLNKQHFQHIEEKRELRNQVKTYQEENEELAEHLRRLTPSNSNVRTLPKKHQIR